MGARGDKLVLASVKSYLGSHGVVAEHVTGETKDERARKRYSLLNRREVRGPVIFVGVFDEPRLIEPVLRPDVVDSRPDLWPRPFGFHAFPGDVNQSATVVGQLAEPLGYLCLRAEQDH